MEVIGAFDAKTKLSELLERASRGESFQITKHGRPIARLVPDRAADRTRSRAAAERLKRMRGMFGAMARAELTALKHEGHRF
ncbi:MAG TPA: type II toxin-antitoxin system prevent-host-death family antitoxin [Phycisphaerales bacterium]|nr:type II toxin-antitoxin system prevent-host-death family antitoxin [Phycisphaerales bacterium]HMP37777.1 type II toxin-antitoxin system prevent-host-death family antitoxin [Phycisphaerales bacterium]